MKWKRKVKAKNTMEVPLECFMAVQRYSAPESVRFSIIFSTEIQNSTSGPKKECAPAPGGLKTRVLRRSLRRPPEGACGEPPSAAA